MNDHITTGFLPLLDSVILVAAKEFGFAEEENIDLSLVRETSWANIRDRMAIGHFEAAHMLAPMPIAANLGLTQMPISLIAPMALGLGGNAITLAIDLANEIAEDDAPTIDPAKNGKALRKAVVHRQENGLPRLRFGVVHPHSGHNLELRYWLSASGIDPNQDVEIIIVPPSLMPDALATSTLDGFCVGEPWNSVAVKAGDGSICTVKSEIWRGSPEKVLALKTEWAENNEELTHRFLRALYRSAHFCSQSENRQALATTLSGSAYLEIDADLIIRGLSGNIHVNEGKSVSIDNFFIPFERAATFPWQSHALWFYSQMVRWSMIDHAPRHVMIARNSYRPDLYRLAVKPLHANLPTANAKVEGALSQPTPVGSTHQTLTLGPDGFFDEGIFDPDLLDEYLRQNV